MNYVKVILSGVAAISLAAFLPGGWIYIALNGYSGITERKATGLGAVAGGITASLFSPLFWILAILFFALFFAASRLGSKFLRGILFWTPTLIISTLGFGIFSLCAYAWLHSRRA